MRTNFILDSVLSGLRRNLTMTIALVLNTAITLAFIGAAFLANTEISRFKDRYEGKLNVSVFLCTSVNTGQGGCTGHPVFNGSTKAAPAGPTGACTDLPVFQSLPPGASQTTGPDGKPEFDATTSYEQCRALVAKLSDDPLVASFSYISQAQQFALARRQLPADNLVGLQAGSLASSFTIKLRNIQADYPKFVQEYSHGVAGVEEVQNASSTINTLLDIINGIRLFSVLIALVVLIASILLIGNTIQVAAQQRRNETSIMRLVGASRWMTELPFLLETTIATLVGGIISGGILFAGKFFVLGNIFKGQVDRGVIPDLSGNDLLVAGGIGLIGGVVIAGFTAFLTLRLYVKL